MGKDIVADSNYVLSRGESETNRLNQQYNFAKRVIGRTSALPSSIDPKGISKVLDVAAGSLAWTLDLARTPGISTRLCPESNDPIRLYGCDISSAQFPPEEITSELGITVFVHDITTPFPEEMKRTFDLVNMRLLVLALSEQGWKKALKNVHELLKPGGLLLIYEADTRYVRSSGKQAARKFEARVPLDENASDWMSRTNAVMQRSCMDVNGFIPDLTDRLPSMLDNGLFHQESCALFAVPIGAAAARHEAGEVKLTADEGNFLAENLRIVRDTAFRGALSKGVLRGVDGPIDTEEGRLAALEEMTKGLYEEGAFSLSLEIVARKF